MSSQTNPASERRIQPRLPGPFPVRVRVTNAGRVFDTHTLADNLSEGGLYLQLPAQFTAGTRLFTLCRLPGGASVAARCRVLRTDAKPLGLCGVAVRFSRARMLASTAV
ncbi:MAG TPA: PilZ domain-containing protein [Methylococcaceae bacterium]|nr:PilZ domain-containing protein [Methylococcaceae bacterium]